MLDAAQSSFAEATQVLERMGAAKERDGVDSKVVESTKAVKRVVVANQLAVTQLQRQLDGGKNGKVSVGLTHHPHLVSVQVRAAT